MRPPYETLGLRPGAHEQDVRAAWRRTARATHPDRGGDPARFRQAQDAYRALLAGTYRPFGPLPTVVRHQGSVALASRWWRRRADRRRRPRVL